MPARPWGGEGLCLPVPSSEFVDPLALPRLHAHPVMQPDGCSPGSSEAGNRWPNVFPGRVSNPKCHTAQPCNVRIWNRDTDICKLKLASRQLRSFRWPARREPWSPESVCFYAPFQKTQAPSGAEGACGQSRALGLLAGCGSQAASVWAGVRRRAAPRASSVRPCRCSGSGSGWRRASAAAAMPMAGLDWMP